MIVMLISGGRDHRQQWTKYDMLKDEMTDFGEEYLDSPQHGYSTYFTQINETTVYTINVNGDSINVYNLQSLSYRDLGTSIPINVDEFGCIASSETPSPRLFISGGNNGSNFVADALDDLQVLSLADMQWMSSPPSMIKTRHRHGCIVVNDKLWAIGGKGRYSVELINTTDIVNENWQINEEIGDLSCALVLMGITTVDSTIFVVGGYCSEHSANTDTVYTIDTVTNNMTVYAGSLPARINGMPVVAIDGTIYGFGGWYNSIVVINYTIYGFSGLTNMWFTLNMLSALSLFLSLSSNI